MKKTFFDLYIKHDILVHRARTTLRSAIEGSQVSQRMKRLLPTVLQERKRNYLEDRFAVAKAERLALTDPEYLHFVERFIEARSKALYDRIMSDSYFKLMDARRSLRAFRGREKTATSPRLTDNYTGRK